MLQSFKMALKSIWGNKMRSFLTMLGIIIGVASVIILVSIVNGYMSYMVESFSSMGVNQITVQYKAVASRSIDVNEFYEFYEEHSDLYENMSPNVSVSVTVKHDSDTMDSTSVGGYSEDYLAIKDYEIEYGRNLQYSDMEARRKVAVIGAYVAEMNGVDVLVFTAGLGENDARAREKIASDLEFLGIRLDKEKNRNMERGVNAVISTDDSPVKVLVIPTDEEYMIAADTMKLVGDR